MPQSGTLSGNTAFVNCIGVWPSSFLPVESQTYAPCGLLLIVIVLASLSTYNEWHPVKTAHPTTSASNLASDFSSSSFIFSPLSSGSFYVNGIKIIPPDFANFQSPKIHSQNAPKSRRTSLPDGLCLPFAFSQGTTVSVPQRETGCCLVRHQFQFITADEQLGSKQQLYFQNFNFLAFLKVSGVESQENVLYYHRFQKSRNFKVLKVSV